MSNEKLSKSGEKEPGLTNGVEMHKFYSKPHEQPKKEERTIHDITTYDLLYLRGLCEKNKGKSDVDSFYDFINCVLTDDNVGPLSGIQVKLLGFYEKNCPQMVKNALELSRHVSETETEVVYQNGKHIKKVKRNDKDYSKLVDIMDLHDEQTEIENQLDIDKTVAQLQKEANIFGTKLSVYRKAAKNSGLKLQKGKLVPLSEQDSKTCETENHDEFWKDVSKEDVSVYDITEQQSTEIYERELPKSKNLKDMVNKVLGNCVHAEPKTELNDLEEYAKCAHETEELKLAYIEFLQTRLTKFIVPETGEPRSIKDAEKLVDIIKFLETPKDIEHNYQLGENYISESTILDKANEYITKNKKPQD